MIDLVLSRFRDPRPDILLLMAFEKDCLRASTWTPCHGPILFQPTKASTRLFTLLHLLVRRFHVSRTDRPIVSLGLPYRHYLFGKTFPHFAASGRMRVLWSYDVWEPRFDEIAAIVRDAQVDVLLLSSYHATEHFRAILPECDVHWVPEAIELARYPPKPWSERSIDVVSFGRGSDRYHEAIADGCRERGIHYLARPHFATPQSFIEGICDARISICFPRSETHPAVAGSVSTLTLRYLESMAAKCLVLGGAPFDAPKMFGYNPIVEVDWADPVAQLEQILQDPSHSAELIEKNYRTVAAQHQTRNFVERVEAAIRERQERQRQ